MLHQLHKIKQSGSTAVITIQTELILVYTIELRRLIRSQIKLNEWCIGACVPPEEQRNVFYPGTGWTSTIPPSHMTSKMLSFVYFPQRGSPPR